METRYRITNGALPDPITVVNYPRSHCYPHRLLLKAKASPFKEARASPRARLSSRRYGIFRRRVGYDRNGKADLTMRSGFYARVSAGRARSRTDLADFTPRVRRLVPKSCGNFITP